MPELNWVGKNKVINHHLDVPYRVLERQYSFDQAGQHEEDNGSENMIIHGDNLEALKALLPRYEGQVDVIYIDPPYNTGNEGWVYNDAVNDPQIKKWLGEVVGKEGEDLSRHDKWLCMMYPRLRLIQRLMSRSGVLAISISGHELNSLLAICKEIFAAREVTVVTVQTSGGKPSNGFNISTEYLVFVTPDDFEPNAVGGSRNSYASPYHGMNLATFNQVERPNQAYPIYIDGDGKIVGVGPSLQQRIDSGNYLGAASDFEFDFDEAPEGCVSVWPITSKGVPCVWRLIPERLMNDWQQGYIKVVPLPDSSTSNLYSVQYLSAGIIEQIKSGSLKTYRSSSSPDIPTLEVEGYEPSGGSVPTIWLSKAFFTARGGDEITEILGKKSAFTYPKPTDLIKEFLRRTTTKNSIVLDSFAGSGTTAHAVLDLNRADGGNRHFILVELGDYANEVTAERVKRVVKGYEAKKPVKNLLYDAKISTALFKKGEKVFAEARAIADEAKTKYEKVVGPSVKDGQLQVVGQTSSKSEVPGLGGDFSFYELGSQLMVDANLNPAVPVGQVRDYIWFTETRLAVPDVSSVNPYYLGSANGAVYYFIYEPDAVTVLDHEFLATMDAAHQGESYIIYADVCELSQEELAKLNIVFKKIPRDITRL